MTFKKHEKKLQRFMIYILAFFIVLYVLLPYSWLIISSISTKAELMNVPLKWIPKNPTLDNYADLFLGRSNSTTDATSQFKQALINSAIISLAVTAISIVIGVLAAYGFARFRFRGRKTSFLFVLITQMIPPIAIIIPLYMIMLKLNLMDNKISLIVIYLSFILPFEIWILKGYLANIPVELEESARIDGCSRMKSFFKIILPLSSSGLASTTIFAFIIAWNEFFYAMSFTTKLKAKTLPVLITEFSSKFGADYIMVCTVGVVASLPPFLLALIFQKYIIAGLTAGAVKG